MIYSSTYKSEARASPPGLSIRIIAALNFFDSTERKDIMFKDRCDEKEGAINDNSRCAINKKEIITIWEHFEMSYQPML